MIPELCAEDLGSCHGRSCVCVCVCVHPVSGAGARQIEEREPRSVEAGGGAHEEAYT
jgi:hypothetical protein